MSKVVRAELMWVSPEYAAGVIANNRRLAARVKRLNREKRQLREVLRTVAPVRASAANEQEQRP